MGLKTLILYCPECGTERERSYVLDQNQKVYTADNIEYCDRERCGAVPLKVKSHSYDENYHAGREYLRSRYPVKIGAPLTGIELEAWRERRAREEENNRLPTEEELQKQATAELREQIKRQFFAANPSASLADFKRLYPTLRDRHLIEAAENEPDFGEGTRGEVRRYINRRYGPR